MSNREKFTNVGWLDINNDNLIKKEDNYIVVNEKLELREVFQYDNRENFNEDNGINDFIERLKEPLKDTASSYQAYFISQPYYKNKETTWVCNKYVPNEYKLITEITSATSMSESYNHQFLFIPSQDNDKSFYIYNIQYQKYINVDGFLRDEPQNISILGQGKYEDTIVLQFGNSGDNIINVNSKGNISIDSWGGNTGKIDGGNSCEIRKANNTYYSVSFYTCDSANGPYIDGAKNEFKKTIYVKHNDTTNITINELISLLNLTDNDGKYAVWGDEYSENKNITENKVYYLYPQR